MRVFGMYRKHDVSGVSGTGVVAEGCEYSDGTVAVRWASKNNPNSTGIYDSFNDFYNIHIHEHPTNETIVRWKTIEDLFDGDEQYE